jgi:hypothetical protein
MPAKLNFFKTPASVRLVSSQTVSTSTGISGCYRPHRQTAMPGQKSVYETFLSPTDDPAVRSDHSRTSLYTFVYNTRSVHMYCQNKVSILLLVVLFNQILVCKVFYIMVNPCPRVNLQSNAEKIAEVKEHKVERMKNNICRLGVYSNINGGQSPEPDPYSLPFLRPLAEYNVQQTW